MKTQYVLGLNQELEATITLTEAGQQPPYEGNKVTVQCKIALPADEFGQLVPELRFGAKILNSPMGGWTWWGNPGDGCRFVTKKFHGKTWKKARRQAAKWARESIMPIREALAERAKALEEAGDWE